jgi:uncharacterized protein YkvS
MCYNGLRDEAADRIDDLVESNKELTLQLLATQGQAADALDKLAKAVEALNIVDLAIMENTDELEWRLWGEGAVSGIRTVLAELEGK